MDNKVQRVFFFSFALSRSIFFLKPLGAKEETLAADYV